MLYGTIFNSVTCSKCSKRVILTIYFLLFRGVLEPQYNEIAAEAPILNASNAVFDSLRNNAIILLSSFLIFQVMHLLQSKDQTH